MNDTSDPEFITGEQAIFNKDAAALALALEGGWALPHTCTRSGQGDADLSLLFQCISWRWMEGWELLSARWPEFKSDYRILRRVLANAWPEVLAQMVPHHFELDQGDSSSLLVDFMQTVANPNNEYLVDEDIGRCMQHLIAHGEDAATMFPGDFEPGDLRLAGHTPWTLAVRNKRWSLAGMLAPSAATARRHPRFEETMDTWFYSGFMRESPLRPEPSTLARDALIASAGLVVPWLDESCVLFMEQAWPLLLALSPADRQGVWEWASKPGTTQADRLEVLSSGLVDGCANNKEEAVKLCGLMVREAGPGLREAWHRKAGESALSAADTWSMGAQSINRANPLPDPFN